MDKALQKLDLAVAEFRRLLNPSEAPPAPKKGKVKPISFATVYSNWIQAIQGYYAKTASPPAMDEFLTTAMFSMLLPETLVSMPYLLPLLETHELFTTEALTIIAAGSPHTETLLESLGAVGTLPSPMDTGYLSTIHREALKTLLGSTQHCEWAAERLLQYRIKPSSFLDELVDSAFGCDPIAADSALWVWLHRVGCTSVDALTTAVGPDKPLSRLLALLEYTDAKGDHPFHVGLHDVVMAWLAAPASASRQTIVDSITDTRLPAELMYDCLYALGHSDAYEQRKALRTIHAAIDAGAPLDLAQAVRVITPDLTATSLADLVGLIMRGGGRYEDLLPLWSALAGHYFEAADPTIAPVFCGAMSRAVEADTLLTLTQPAMKLLLHLASQTSATTDIAVGCILGLTEGPHAASNGPQLLRLLQPYLLRPILERCSNGAASLLDGRLLAGMAAKDTTLLDQAVSYWFETPDPALRLQGARTVPGLLKLMAEVDATDLDDVLGRAFVYTLRGTVDPAVSVRAAAAAGIVSLGSSITAALRWTTNSAVTKAEPPVRQAVLKSCLVAAGANRLPPITAPTLHALAAAIEAASAGEHAIVRDNSLALLISLPIAQATVLGLEAVGDGLIDMVGTLVESFDRFRGSVLTLILTDLTTLLSKHPVVAGDLAVLVPKLLVVADDLGDYCTPTDSTEACAAMRMLRAFTSLAPDTVRDRVDAIMAVGEGIIEPSRALDDAVVVEALKLIQSIFMGQFTDILSKPGDVLVADGEEFAPETPVSDDEAPSAFVPATPEHRTEGRATPGQAAGLRWLASIGKAYLTRTLSYGEATTPLPDTLVVAAFRDAIHAIWAEIIGTANREIGGHVASQIRGTRDARSMTEVSLALSRGRLHSSDADAAAVTATLCSLGPAAIGLMTDLALQGAAARPVEQALLKVLGLTATESDQTGHALSVVAGLVVSMRGWSLADEYLDDVALRLSVVANKMAAPKADLSALGTVAAALVPIVATIIRVMEPEDVRRTALVDSLNVFISKAASITKRDVQRVLVSTCANEQLCLDMVHLLIGRAINAGLAGDTSAIPALASALVPFTAESQAAIDVFDTLHAAETAEQPIGGPVTLPESAVSPYGFALAFADLICAEPVRNFIETPDEAAIVGKNQIFELIKAVAALGAIEPDGTWYTPTKATAPSSGKAKKAKGKKAKPAKGPVRIAQVAWAHLAGATVYPDPVPFEMTALGVAMLSAMLVSGVDVLVDSAAAQVPAIVSQVIEDAQAISEDVLGMLGLLLDSIAVGRVCYADYLRAKHAMSGVVETTEGFGSDNVDGVKMAIRRALSRPL
ncbi:hypothetical protein J8273_7516 [Carpediemonas membranifera]|uniref:Uncharacterized protein n=1 Tax=Carpediemonas membranifera TaxID=201153 RepID=A0A8J6B6X0_9EUKA|nr:hypothetical protein J8273_7516 [Carpediemonas membranifera]|eukprot:KAG9391242.1 hypothetical protein J8273_7516 [Carpediemonas membranifera]